MARTGSARAGSERERWNIVLSRSIIAAVALHAGVLAFELSLDGSTPARSSTGGPPLSVVVAHAVSSEEIPAPPGPIAQLALPAVAELPLDLAALLPTLDLPSFDEPIVPGIPAPPRVAAEDEWARYVAFSPVMVRPEIRNRKQIEHFLRRHYQPIIAATGATGIVRMLFWLDETGMPQRSEIAETSGYPELDSLSIRLSQVVRFTPAIRAGEAVRVTVEVPFRFEAL